MARFTRQIRNYFPLQQLKSQPHEISSDRRKRRPARKSSHLTNRFDHVICSFKVGAIKPIKRANMQRFLASLFGLVFLAQTFAAAPAPKPADTAADDAAEERESQKFLKSIQWTRGPAEA